MLQRKYIVKRNIDLAHNNVSGRACPGGGKSRFMNPLLNSFNWIFQISRNTQIINTWAVSRKLASELLCSLFFPFCAHQHMLCGTGGNFVMFENVKKCTGSAVQWKWLCTKKISNFPVFEWCIVIMDVYKSQREDWVDDTPTVKGMDSKVCLWKLNYPCEFSHLSWLYHTAWHSFGPYSDWCHLHHVSLGDCTRTCVGFITSSVIFYACKSC